MSKAGKKLITAAKEAVDYARNYAPGTYGCHEALHMTSYFASAIEEELCEHRSILANPEWRKLASSAARSLEELYQAIGAQHLGSDDHSVAERGITSAM